MLYKHIKNKTKAQLFREIKRKNQLIKKLQQSKNNLLKTNRELQKKNDLYRKIGVTDKLTGLYNRHYLDQTIYEEFKKADRNSCPVSVVIIDLDNFKQINDNLGHGVGDDVLIKVGNVIRKFTRLSDICVRWGGDEFLILMPQTSLKGAYTVAKKLKNSIALISLQTNEQVTASFGLVERKNNESWTNCFKRVDKLLYCAKSKGKNRIK